MSKLSKPRYSDSAFCLLLLLISNASRANEQVNPEVPVVDENTTAANLQADNAATQQAPSATSQDVNFDSSLIFGDNKNVDLSRFSKPEAIIPGQYQTWMTLNNDASFDQEVNVLSTSASENKFCFTKADLVRWGVKLDKIDPERLAASEENGCFVLTELIPAATVNLDISQLTLQVTVPQAYMGQIRRGYIDPAEWDYGITAGFIRYNLYGSYIDSDTRSRDSYNATINTGFNWDRWRIRHNANMNYNDSFSYNTINTYVQTDVTPLRAQYTMGEYFSPADILDSVPFTGAQIASDDSMLPDSERGYAPVVRGTANTNAEVEISQNDRVIYRTSVPPGTFEITDLYATSYSGDLTVTVREADGSENSFIVPYASVVQLLRPDASRFSATAGKYRGNDFDGPWFGQGTYRRGLTNWVTMFGGAQVAEDYYSGVFGMAFATPIGAISVDVTGSYVEDRPAAFDDMNEDTPNHSGQSYRINYNKFIQSTSTSFALAAYRYSTDGYISFNDYAELLESGDDFYSREKNRFQFNVSQPIGDLGNFYFLGIFTDYWNDDDLESYQLGYSKSFRLASVNLNAQRSFDDGGEDETTYRASISIPLNFGKNYNTLTTNYEYSDLDKGHQINTTLSGSFGDTNQYAYSVYANEAINEDDDNDFTYGGNFQYYAPIARTSVSANFSDDSNQYAANVSGTVIGYEGGVLFTPEQGETLAIVEADGAKGARIMGRLNGRLNDSGKAVMGGLTNYRYNNIVIDPTDMESNDVQLKTTSQRVAPRRGAIVRVNYGATTESSLLLRIEGSSVPFGSEVYNEKGQNLGIVGQNGVAFIRGDYQTLEARWADGNGPRNCQLKFNLKDDKDAVDFNMPTPATCDK